MLCSYANRLQGVEPELNNLNIKIKIFEPFIPTYLNKYKMSGCDFEVDLINEVVDFMKLCKTDADSKWGNRSRMTTIMAQYLEITMVEEITTITNKIVTVTTTVEVKEKHFTTCANITMEDTNR